MADTTTIDPRDLANSQLSATQTCEPSGNSQVALASIKAADGRSRMWRVTLGRLNRRDQHQPGVKNAPVDPANPVYTTQGYGYAAADVPVLTSIPPRRSNPVLGMPGDIDPCYVEIAFGMEANAPNRMLAHWPRQGASIDVPGAYVQVWGGVSIHGGVTGDDANALAAFTATVTPSDAGVETDELSLTQFGATGQGNEEAVTMNLATHLTPLNPIAGAGAPQVAMPASVGTWSSTWANHWHRATTMSAHSRAGLVLEARLDQWWNPTTAAWEPLADNIGVIMPPTTTINAMETALLAAANGRVSITIVSANPASTVTATGGVNNYVVTLPLVDPTGAAFYVPDFARRVKVTPVELLTASGFIGANMYSAACGNVGQPTATLIWLDDRGNQVDANGQGGVMDPGTGTVSTTMETPWQEVPAAAVMLFVYLQDFDGSIGVGNRPIFVHWRIAP